jgi:hypothetical protein
MKVILLLSVFLTLFLAAFFLFNLKQDPMVVIQNRLKLLQVYLIEQFYECKSDMDWSYWIRGLEFRRNDILNKVKQGLKIDHGGKSEKKINTLIDNSWDELLGVISAQQRLASGVEEEGIEELDEPEDADAGEPEKLEELNIEDAASKIEFDSGPAVDTDAAEAPVNTELEVVSPFASMLSSLGGKNPAKPNNDEDSPQSAETNGEKNQQNS